jgi:ubiquinone/menaquinone biosynthesis C-methylase UbiE
MTVPTTSAAPTDAIFRGTAEFYDRYRPRYPDAVFDWVNREHALDGRGRLLDAGCGTGHVALPLSRSFDEVIGIDPEPEMLHVAARNAGAQGITNIRFDRMRAEDIPDALAPLRLATFGASFHWMDRVSVANRVFRLLQPGGGLVVLAPSSIWRGQEPWKTVVVERLKHWLGENRRAGAGTFQSGPLHEECLTQTPFVDLKVEHIRQPQVWSAETLIGCLYSMSFASPAVLGTQKAGFERDLRTALSALNPEDRFEEEIEFTIISARKEDTRRSLP